MPDTLLYETDTDDARLTAAAALLLTAEAFGALMEAAARYDAACDE